MSKREKEGQRGVFLLSYFGTSFLQISQLFCNEWVIIAKLLSSPLA